MPKVRNISLSLCLIGLTYAAAITLAWLVAPWLMDMAVHCRMKVNTSLALSGVGFSLLAYHIAEYRPAQRTLLRQIGMITNAVAFAIVAATLFEYLAGIDLHIDLLLTRDALNAEPTSTPGRMAPNAAVCIFFLSLETFFARTLRKARLLPALCLSASSLITLLALLGYAYGAKTFYTISSFICIAPSTAVVALLFCVVQVLDSRSGVLHGLITSRYSGSRMAKQFMPALLLPIAAGWVEILGRYQNWWSREDGATILIAIVVAAFFAFILRSALVQNRVDAQEERLSSALRTLNAVGTQLAAEHDQKKLTQLVTDAATAVTGAEFGAFFYNVHDESGGAFMLYTISGVPIENFSKLPMPRKTAAFAPTFNGEGVTRSANIRKDSLYGKNPPFAGMPMGHILVTSYLSVPVVSRSGAVLGGLFFGHSDEAKFTAGHEELVVSLAAQAAVALDNSQLYQDLNHAVRAREDFLSMASHELKTPLTSLILQLQLAQHRLVNEPKKVSRALAICHEQARRINGLVEDLLDVSRIELGKLQLKFEPVDLAELVEDAATRLADFLEKSGSEFRMHIDVARPFPVVADRFRLDQVLENLLSNSAKYGGGKPITLSLKETGGFAEITVADQGNGVAKDKQALIFNRFERVGDNVNISGLGLGLFIAREIVSAHHGSIAIDSEPGNGAAFTVKLPIHQPSI